MKIVTILKKLAEMINVPADQEKNLNTVTVIYKIKFS